MLRALCSHTISTSAARSFPIVVPSVSFAYSSYYPGFVSFAHSKAAATVKSAMKKAAGSGNGNGTKVQKSIMAFCNVKDSDKAAAKGKGGKSQQSILTFMKAKQSPSDPAVSGKGLAKASENATNSAPNETVGTAGSIPATPPEKDSRTLTAVSSLSPSPASGKQADTARNPSQRKRSLERAEEVVEEAAKEGEKSGDIPKLEEKTGSVTVEKDPSLQRGAGNSGNVTEGEQSLEAAGGKKSSPRKRSPKRAAAGTEQQSDGAYVAGRTTAGTSEVAGEVEGTELLSTTAVKPAKKSSPNKIGSKSSVSARLTKTAAERGEAGSDVTASRQDAAVQGNLEGPPAAAEKLLDSKEGDSSEGEAVEVVAKPRLKRLRKVGDTKEGAIKEGGGEGEGTAVAKRGRRMKAMITDSDEEGSQLAGNVTETEREVADVAMKDADMDAAAECSSADVPGKIKSPQVAPATVAPAVAAVRGGDVKRRGKASASGPSTKPAAGAGRSKKGREAAAGAADVAGAPELLEDEEMRDAGEEMSGSEGVVSVDSEGSGDSSDVSSGEEEEEEGGGAEEGAEQTLKGEKEKTVFSALGKKPSKSASTRRAKGKKGGGNAPGVGDGLAALAEKHADYDPVAAATWEVGEKVPFLFLAEAMDSEWDDGRAYVWIG